MDTEAYLCQDLLQQTEQVATFARALRYVAGRYDWREVEPYAEEAWAQIADNAPAWDEIRDFVREAWAASSE